MAKIEVWCVGWRLEFAGTGVAVHLDPRHRSWCAIAAGKPFAEGLLCVPTLCEESIGFPLGCEERTPTCSECLKRLGRTDDEIATPHPAGREVTDSAGAAD